MGSCDEKNVSTDGCPDWAQKELYEVYVILKILEERAQLRAAVQEQVSFDIVPRGRWL